MSLATQCVSQAFAFCTCWPFSIGATTNADFRLCSFVLCAVNMFWLHVLNRSKIARCAREGITIDKLEAFAELGDGSPLYRCVHCFVEGPLILSFAHKFGQIYPISVL